MSKLLAQRTTKDGVSVRVFHRGNIFHVYHGTHLTITDNIGDANRAYNKDKI